ncbi:MAG: peptidylprolyl isomerase [Verrucomicrobiota bacterium]|nr:peptidylprolyl isomerase [Verrucomicrobiota bacterium]
MKTVLAVIAGALTLALAPARGATANDTPPPAVPAAASNSLNTTITQLFGDPAVAKGKGFEIKQSQLDKLTASVRAAAAAHGQAIPPERLKAVEAAELNQLIDIQMLLQKATPADKAAGRADFDKSLKAVKTAQKLNDSEFDSKLGEQLKLQNMTRAEWDQQHIDQATVLAVLKRELKVNVSEAEAKKFYDEHQTDFEQPEMVRVRHILLLTIDPTTHQPLPPDQQAAKHKQIEALLKRVRAGEDFAKLAKEYSEDPASKDNGGELPPFPRGQMVPEFEAAAFSLKTNEVSDIVTTAYGYHIIQLLDKIPAKTEPFTGLDTKIPGNRGLTLRDVLEAQAIQKEAPQYMLALRKADDVQILDPELMALQQQADAEAAAGGAADQTNTPPAAK